MSKNRSKASISFGGSLANDSDGYAGNGLSIFTRAAARKGRPQFLNETPARLAKGRKLPLHDLIREYAGRVRWLEAELRTETDTAKRRKLTKTLEIKSRRLTELRRELGGGHDAR
jgi:hypothetical protein